MTSWEQQHQGQARPLDSAKLSSGMPYALPCNCCASAAGCVCFHNGHILWSDVFLNHGSGKALMFFLVHELFVERMLGAEDRMPSMPCHLGHGRERRELKEQNPEPVMKEKKKQPRGPAPGHQPPAGGKARGKAEPHGARRARPALHSSGQSWLKGCKLF